MKMKATKRNTPPTQAEQLAAKLTRSGFKPVRSTVRETLLKKGKLSFVVRRDGSVLSIAPRTGTETLLIQPAVV